MMTSVAKLLLYSYGCRSMKCLYERMLHWRKILTGEDRSVSQKHVPRLRTGRGRARTSARRRWRPKVRNNNL